MLHHRNQLATTHCLAEAAAAAAAVVAAAAAVMARTYTAIAVLL